MQKLKLAHKTVLFFMWIDVNLKINPSSFKSHERLYSLIAPFFSSSSAVTTSAKWRVVQILDTSK